MKLRGGLPQLLLRNVDRDVNGWRLQLFEENARLCPGPGAKTNQLATRADALCHFVSVKPENRGLGSGNVIFREVADVLKQRRAALVVKIFARQGARHARQAGDCF